MNTLKVLFTVALMISGYLVNAQSIEMKPEKTTIEWLGKKIGGQHNGEIQLKSGQMEIRDNEIVKGNFVIDMTSITNTDLEDEGYNQKLVGHLKSDDFFGVAKYPTAKLVISEGGKFTNGKTTVTGKITIKGKTETITFDVIKGSGQYTAKLEIDRSKFDVKYGSNSFFDNLGDKAINDIFTIDVQIRI